MSGVRDIGIDCPREAPYSSGRMFARCLFLLCCCAPVSQSNGQATTERFADQLAALLRTPIPTQQQMQTATTIARQAQLIELEYLSVPRRVPTSDEMTQYAQEARSPLALIDSMRCSFGYGSQNYLVSGEYRLGIHAAYKIFESKRRRPLE